MIPPTPRCKQRSSFHRGNKEEAKLWIMQLEEKGRNKATTTKVKEARNAAKAIEEEQKVE